MIDFVCTAGPEDRPFEERHNNPSVAIVVGGTFQYSCPAGCDLMTPGALLLGNAGDCFTCKHEHGAGDRCLSFSYAPEFFERLAREAGARGSRFKVPRIPTIRSLAPLVAEASALLSNGESSAWEELAIEVAAQAIQLGNGIVPRSTPAEPSSVARVTRVLRMIENDQGMGEELTCLAQVARLSPYHFLRTFERLTGTTPHQYVLRMRLRRASVRLTLEKTKISDSALDCGFGDISNFNRTFRAEFGMSPRNYRRSA